MSAWGEILGRDTLGAFCRHTHAQLEGSPDGLLAGTAFGVKDLYHIAGRRTGFGNPAWLETHPPADRTAVAVQRLLDAGARMVGKTHTDELAYSLNGENKHYGTPVNPNAAGRIPGGSSSGSAVAVAGGLVDFALGSDTGGSVRIPASYCGVIGMRVTHGAVPLDGAIAFAPSYDTAGWFARDAALFERVGRVLLGDHAPAKKPGRLLVAADAFARAGDVVAAVLSAAIGRVSALLGPAESVNLSAEGLEAWMNDFRVIQASEIWSTHSGWVGGLQADLGGGIKERFAWASTITAADAGAASARRNSIARRMDELLADNAVLVVPTAPGIAPLIGTPVKDLENWRNRCLGLLCIAGHAGLPQLSLPLATLDGCPLGLSLIAARGSDTMLLDLAKQLGSGR
jgi:amidase